MMLEGLLREGGKKIEEDRVRYQKRCTVRRRLQCNLEGHPSKVALSLCSSSGAQYTGYKTTSRQHNERSAFLINFNSRRW